MTRSLPSGWTAGDTRGIAPGWTGPVELRGFRAGGSEVCLQSRYDHTYRWYALENGAPLGGPSPDEPAQVEPPSVWDSPLDVGEPLYEMAEVTVTRAGATSVRALYPLSHDDEIHVLPGERVLLAGFSGAALIDFGMPAAGAVTRQDPAAALPEPETASNLLPRDAWWDSGRLTRLVLPDDRAAAVAELYGRPEIAVARGAQRSSQSRPWPWAWARGRRRSVARSASGPRRWWRSWRMASAAWRGREKRPGEVAGGGDGRGGGEGAGGDAGDQEGAAGCAGDGFGDRPHGLGVASVGEARFG
ncbi:hypothetical protein BX265_7502 [Streptomyces sp. TLI_235]|nr:hypothetical protein [Streptomyces sp. TLI_235]PBC70113.1 hypothetical protein BX265_7502 [Streptomyces sp. TLI_235]